MDQKELHNSLGSLIKRIDAQMTEVEKAHQEALKEVGDSEELINAVNIFFKRSMDELEMTMVFADLLQHRVETLINFQ